jgi:DNA-binding NarL/FixJ family response regulator
MKPSSPNRKIRIMIVEDHVLVRMGLVSATNNEPDMEVVAEVEDGRQVVEAFRNHQVDVVLLDLRLPGIDGVEITRALRHQFGAVRILMLSGYGGGDDIARAMQAGASGYIVKGMALEQLLEGIRKVHAGEQYLPPEIARRLSERMESDISAREVEVLRLIAKGKSNKEIASHLGIVEGTVNAHLANIFSKLGAADRAQAIAIAIQRQILQLD